MKPSKLPTLQRRSERSYRVTDILIWGIFCGTVAVLWLTDWLN